MIPAIVSYATWLIAAAVMLGVFFYIYTKVTPFDEVALIHKGNTAASLSLAGAMVGFSLTMASAILHNSTLISFVTWAAGAMVVQILVFAVVSRLLHTVRPEIETGNTAMGGLMGAVSLVAGIINAACLS